MFNVSTGLHIRRVLVIDRASLNVQNTLRSLIVVALAVLSVIHIYAQLYWLLRVETLSMWHQPSPSEIKVNWIICCVKLKNVSLRPYSHSLPPSHLLWVCSVITSEDKLRKGLRSIKILPRYRDDTAGPLTVTTGAISMTRLMSANQRGQKFSPGSG